MTYIVFKRFKSTAVCGYINLQYGTECDGLDNVILYKGKPICYVTSQNAHDYFARNDDGQGLLRGKLTQSILKCLASGNGVDPRTDKVYQAKWDKVWADGLCQKYKRIEFDDYWLWNHDFYNAPIEDLQYIAKLVGAKEG